jgi:23S rRNA (cytidine2498-2'-O)-methyltransferase
VEPCFLYLCATGFEAALVREAGGQARTLCPGVVAAARLGDFVFARQVLPDAVRLSGPSITRLGEKAAAALAAALDAQAEPWRLDVLLPDDPVDPHRPGELARRAQLCGQVALDELGSRWRRLHRRRTGDADANGPPPILAQLLLTSREELWVSVARPQVLPTGGLWPVRFPGGRVAVPDDWNAPSSAYRKLEEALAWLGCQPRAGERCVDLGAAPGGWSHVLLSRGAEVVAVDRAELDPRLVRQRGLVHLRRDGFSYQPDDPPVDWLVCDIIATPQRSLALLDRWLAAGWTRNLVFHLKFKGQKDYALADAARARLGAAEFHCMRVKHLLHDRNEVTVMAASTARSRGIRSPSAPGSSPPASVARRLLP